MSTDGRLTTHLRATIRAWHGAATSHTIPAITSGVGQVRALDHGGAIVAVRDDFVPDDRITLAFQYRNRSFTLHAVVLEARAEEDGRDGAFTRVVEVRFEEVPPLTAGRLASVLAVGRGREHGRHTRASA